MQATGDGLRNSDDRQHRAKILIVDDRHDKLLAFQSILHELEQELFTARSGEEALKLMLAHEFAVVLLDVNMPGLDGLETAALVRRRKKTAHTPIIFITAYADEMLTMQGYSLGAVDYILSPVVPEILRSKVKVFVDLFCMSQNAKLQAEERIALAQEQAARAAAEEANRRSSFLAEASRALSGSLDFHATVQELFSVTIPGLADLCAFTAVDEQGRLGKTEFSWTLSGERRGGLSGGTIPPALAAGVEQALATRKPQSLKYHLPEPAPPQSDLPGDGDAAARAWVPPIFSAAIFPLTARGRMIGVLCFGLGTNRRVIKDSDWSLMEDLANRAAIALDNTLLYQQLQNADHQKNEFIAMLGHELRNPLAPIRNAVDVLRIVRSDPSRLNWVQGILERQVRHLTRLVDDLLDVSRITRGKLELQLASLDISSVISAAVELSLPLINARKHSLTVSMPDETLRIKADPGRIAQVMGNLLNNAAKYTPEGGRISLTVGLEADQVVFRVADTGIGFSQEMGLKLFELFAQGEPPPGAIREGLGIGLTLVHRLVELHGGTVDAFSAGLDKGSEFVVRVPALDELGVESAVASQPASERAPRNGLKVLVVDDNQDAAQSTAHLLELAGFEVRLAYDGEAALQAASGFHPNAVLLDIGLPMMDGYEVARRLRALSTAEQLTLIAASGYGQEEDRQRSIEAGFDSHLTKPLDPAQLTNLLISLCSRGSGANGIQR